MLTVRYFCDYFSCDGNDEYYSQDWFVQSEPSFAVRSLKFCLQFLNPESLFLVSHLISEDVGQDPAHGEDDEQQQHEHRVGQQQAFHLLGGGEAPEHGEEDGEVADDDDDVRGVGVEMVPQQLRHEQLVIHGPDAECEEDKAADLEYNNPVLEIKHN